MPDLFSELKRIKAKLTGVDNEATGEIRGPAGQITQSPDLKQARGSAEAVTGRHTSKVANPSKAPRGNSLGRNVPGAMAQQQAPIKSTPRSSVGHNPKAGPGQTRLIVKPPAPQPAPNLRAAVTPVASPAAPVHLRQEVVAAKLPEPVSQLFRPLPKGALTRQSKFRSAEAWISAGGRTQITAPEHVGALDVVIGLDFGTSYTKAAVGFKDKIFPVTWEGVSQCEPSYLLPSEYTQLDDGSVFIGQHPSARQDEIRADLKLPFINPAVSSASIGRAASFLGLVLRYIRAWLFHHHGSKLGRALVRWQLNIGAPSDGLENERLINAYRRLAASAWMLSLEADPQQLAKVSADSWQEGQPLEDLVDLQVRPEFLAQMAGYMQSPQRQRGLHALVDVGGGTLDVVTFIVHQIEGDDTFPFLVPEVHALGTHGLIQNRYAGIEGGATARPIDELAPIPSAPDFARATGLALGHVATRDALFRDELQRVIKGVLETTKSKRYRLSDAWQNGIRTFFTGGGSRLDLYRDAIAKAKVPSESGLLLMPLPPHKNMDGFAGGQDEYQRVSVACGLAQDAFTLGRIVPAKEVEDDRAVVSYWVAVRPDRDELYPK